MRIVVPLAAAVAALCAAAGPAAALDCGAPDPYPEAAQTVSGHFAGAGKRTRLTLRKARFRIGGAVVDACYLQHGNGPAESPVAQGWAGRAQDLAEIAGVCRDAAGGPKAGREAGPDRAVVRVQMGRYADILFFSAGPAAGGVRLVRVEEADALTAAQAMAQAARGGCVPQE